jgi:Type II secretion system (T2SS), protein E, N-terminal domain
MARLGEQLASAGVVSTDKVDQALRAQVVWGARLGTNLIELGCLDLDGLSRALGQLHGIPAALGRHFDKADPELQALLSDDLAMQFSVVPLVRLSPERIAVVAIDPLGPDALIALGRVYGVSPLTGIVTSVAAELRVLYHLERVYKIARPTRYLRSKGASRTMELPAFTNVPEEVDIDVDIAVPIEVDETAHPTGRAEQTSIDSSLRSGVPLVHESADDVAALIDHAIDSFTMPAVSPTEPQGRERRTYVRTLADAVEPVTGDEPTRPVSRLPSTTTEPPPKGALGRIAIRRVAIPATAIAGATTDTLPIITTNLPDATRAIRRGPNRDRVAELVLETIDRFVPTCQAALLLVIRGDVAIGWKQFCRIDEGTIEIAVPLDQPGLVPSVIQHHAIARCHVDDLGPIDGRLLRALGGSEGDLVVVPIMIGDQVMCLLAAAIDDRAEVAPLETIASAASTAFARLIREFSR